MEAGTRTVTMIDAFVDLDFNESRIGATMRAVGLIFVFNLLLALAAQVRIPLFFTPVPITAQTFVVLLTGALLGPRLGAAAMAAYLLEGAMGLPVFQGGNSGAAYMFGPTGGYLIGFIASASIVGWFAKRGFDRRFITAVAAMAIAEIALYSCGLAWLSNFAPSGKLLEMGLLPFIPGDVIKIVAAAVALPMGWTLLEKLGRK